MKAFALLVSLFVFAKANAQQITSIAEALKKNAKEVVFLTVDASKEGHLLKELGGFTYLRDLTLYNMAEFPSELAGLRTLQFLRIKKSSFKTMPKAIYAAWYSLTHLSIEAQLISLPEGFGKIPRIKNLDLSNNQLTDIPETILNLKTLEEVNLANNRITSLSPSIGDWLQAKRIDLKNNLISSIPKEVGNLPSLEYFVLDNNKIVELPDEIGNISTLKGLALDGNLLKKLPKGLANLRQLNALNASKNPIEDIDEALLSQAKIATIGVENTKIGIDKLKYLEKKYPNILLFY